jgi:preprotein translocase subunit YajC
MTLALLSVQPLLQAAGGGGLRSLAPFLIQIVAFFAIFYFILIRPQQKQRKQHEARLMALKKGDGVVTAGGIVAEVVAVKQSLKDGQPQPSLGDEITIKSAETKLVVERGRIARVLGDGGTAAPAQG